MDGVPALVFLFHPPVGGPARLFILSFGIPAVDHPFPHVFPLPVPGILLPWVFFIGPRAGFLILLPFLLRFAFRLPEPFVEFLLEFKFLVREAQEIAISLG